MHETFRTALNPQPRHVCLRLPLKPLQLGHLWYLHELRSPLMAGQPFLFGHLLVAVLICSVRQNTARILLGWFWWLLIPFAWAWGFHCRKLDLSKEAEKFSAYLSDERTMPPLTPPPKEQRRAVAAPWEWTLYDFLRTSYGMSKRKALGAYVREANACWTVNRDAAGRVTLATAPQSEESLIKGIWQRQREAGLRPANN